MPPAIASGKPLYEVSQMTTAIMLVEAGLGAAVLPAYIWSFARSREIVSRPLDRAAGDAQRLSDPAGKPLAFAGGGRLRAGVAEAHPRRDRAG